MRSTCRTSLVLGALSLAAGLLFTPAAAVAQTFSGFLNDPANTALVASDLGPALFGDDLDIANNVALHTLTIGTADNYTFASVGFAAGGADPYFTLFEGIAPSATFVGSNFDSAFSTGGDFSLVFALTPGTYTLAIGAFANMSFAENLGAGTLGDGFVGLGGPSFLGTTFYELQVDVGGEIPPPVPEPSSALLLASGLIAAALWKTRSSRS